MPKRVFLGVLLPSFGLRLAVLLATSPIISHDTPGYLNLAKGIASWNLHGDWGLRTPVYALFLLLCRSSPTGVAAVQTLVIGTGITLLAAWTTWVITKHELAAAVAGLAYGLNLMQIATEVTVLPETLSTFLLMATFASIAWVALSAGGRGSLPVKYICLGTSAGLLCLTRPQYLYVPLVVLGFTVWQCRRRWALLGLVAVLSLGPAIGWSTFNYVRIGYFGPTTQAGFSLTNHTGAYIEDAPDRYATIKEIYLAERAARGGDHENVIWSVIGPMSEKTGMSYPELSRELTSMSLYLIRTHPAQYAKATAEGMVGFWKGTGRYNSSLKLATAGAGHIAWVLNKYLVIAVNALFLCSVVMFLSPRQRRRIGDGATQIVWGVGATIVLGSCLVQAMVEYGASARLGMPAYPVVAVLLASFVSLRWFSHDRQPKTRHPPSSAQSG